MATAAAALMVRARREIQHHFFSNDAVRPDRAVAFEPANSIERRQFERLRRANVVHEVSGGRYWLDVVAYDIMLCARYRRVRTALLIVIAGLIVILLTAAVMVRTGA